MPLKSLNDIISRISAGYGENLGGSQYKYPSTNGSGQQGIGKGVHFNGLPSSFPSGVTGWIPTFHTSFAGNTNSSGTLLVAGINLGTANFGAASFTDGVAYPTRTELGVASVPTFGPIVGEVTTALNGGAGSATITYTDQAGNTGNTVGMDVPGSASKDSMFLQFSYASGDYGVRDITNVTYSGQSSPAGVVKLWGIIPLAFVFSGTNEGQQGCADLLGSEFNFISLPNTVEFFTICLGTSERAHFADLYIVGDN